MSNTQALVIEDHDYPGEFIALSPSAGGCDAGPFIPYAKHVEQATAAAERLMQVMAECTRLKSEIANVTEDYAALHQELLTVREERTNAQIERDQYRTMLARVLAVDEACTGDAYAALIADLRKVIGAK